ncbi:MAG: TRAP transporter large permease [Nitriliruptoraceae bacterium]
MEGLALVGFVLGLFITLIIMKMPVAFSVGIGGVAYVIINDMTLGNIPAQLSGAIDSSILIAIPLYLIAGELMNASGVTTRLIDATQLVVGRVRGGMAHTNIASSLVFAGMSGSALADSAGIGKIMIPAMKERGYPAGFSAAVTAASATVGPVFPPSIPFIVYGSITGTSIGALFLAGVIPGVLLTLVLMGWTAVAVRRFTLREERVPLNFTTLIAVFRLGFFPALTPLLILSGIFLGFMTATEAGAIAVLYTVILGFFVYRSLSIKAFFESVQRAMLTSAATLILLGLASIMGWMITLERVADRLVDFLGPVASNFVLVMAVTVLAFLVVGMFMDVVAAMLVFVPVFLPLVQNLGMSSLQFGVVVTVVTLMGLLTPPVGVSLYVTADIAQTSVRRVSVAVLPFLIPIGLLLGLVIAFPVLTEWLPAQRF